MGEWTYPKSPLRYPGGKSRAVKHILPFIPEGVEICSPFIGGGSIELALIERQQNVMGYDAFSPLVAFWQQAILSPKRLASQVAEWHPISRTDFYLMQKRVMGVDDQLLQAAMFFVINRASFSGITLSGGMSPEHPRFNQAAIDRLFSFTARQLWVECKDFHASIPLHESAFLYVDPPYAIQHMKLYGKKGDMHLDFDHAGLAVLLKERTDWLLSYNDCAYIRDLYDGYEIVDTQWSYGMNGSRKSNEILIRG